MTMVRRFMTLGDLVNMADATNVIWGTTEVYLAADYDAIAAACASAEVERDNNAADVRTLEARVATLEAELKFQKDLLSAYHKQNCAAPETPAEPAKPRGKCCTCDNCLGSSTSCRVDAGERLGDLWYCEKRYRESQAKTKGVE
jgi:hypothetical protein